MATVISISPEYQLSASQNGCGEDHNYVCDVDGDMNCDIGDGYGDEDRAFHHGGNDCDHHDGDDYGDNCDDFGDDGDDYRSSHDGGSCELEGVSRGVIGIAQQHQV